MIQKRTLGVISLGVLLVLATPSWASKISSTKMKSYAEIYPQFFQTTTHHIVNHASSHHRQAVTLLINSFNGNTDVDGLSAVLTPSAKPSSLKSTSQIKQLLSQKGLSWQDYQEITHTLAKNPKAFKTFLSDLDRNRIHQTLIAETQEDPSFIRNIHSTDQQIIVRSVLNNFKK